MLCLASCHLVEACMDMTWPGGAQKNISILRRGSCRHYHWYDFHQSPVLATGKEKIALTVEGNEGHLTCHRAALRGKSSKA